MCKTFSPSRLPMEKVTFAPPPIESQLLVFTILFACVRSLPKISSIDEVATVSTIATPLFDHVISTKTLGWLRISIAALFFSATVYRMWNTGYVMRQNYLKQSKLRTIPIHLDGIRSQVMFTMWSWNLLTLSFALNGIICLLSESASSDTIFHTVFHHKWTLRIALIIFEVAAPTSMLVSVVVRYALWPQAMKGPNGSEGLRRPVALLQHNANILASIMEVALFGRIPVRLSEIPFAPMWGILYIFFTWFITHRLVESGEPQFVYFFFDTTLGAKTNCAVLITLMVVQAIFFFLFTVIGDALHHFGGGLYFNVLATALVGLFSCRFRDWGDRHSKYYLILDVRCCTKKKHP